MGCCLIFDTETSDRDNGEIVEAAWLRMLAGGDLLGADDDLIRFDMAVAEGYSGRFKPAKPMTFGSIAVHHILPHELEQYPPSSDFKLPDDCAYVIGHSVDFDWQAAGSPAHVKRICTHAMAQHVWPNATGYSQTALIYMLLGTTDETRELVRNAHSAAADVELNRLLLGHIIGLHPEISRWSQLWTFSEECRIPLTCPMRRHEGVPLDELDRGFVEWCLRQGWLDHYFRIGLERVVAKDNEFELTDDDFEEPF